MNDTTSGHFVKLMAHATYDKIKDQIIAKQK